MFSSVLTLAAAASMAAVQADAPKPTPAPIANIAACRAVTAQDARLRCFDGAAAALDEAIANGAVIAMDRQAVSRTRRELFGFPLPRIPLFGETDEKQPKLLEATLKRAVPVGFNNWSLTLDTGARWQTTGGLPRQNDPKPGQKVKIQRGVLGNYMVSIDGNPPGRAFRMQ